MRWGRSGEEEEVGSTLGCLLHRGQSPSTPAPQAVGMLIAGTVPSAKRGGCGPLQRQLRCSARFPPPRSQQLLGIR